MSGVVIPEEVSFRKVVVKKDTLIPRGRRYHSGFYYQGKMYIFGGSFGSKVVTDEFLSFDFETSEWKEVKSFGLKPSGRYGHSSFLYQDKLFIFGGSGGNNEGMADLFYYDLKTETWSQVSQEGDWPLGRYLHSSVFDEQTKSLYVFAGSSTFRKQRDDFWVLSLETLKWRQVSKPEGSEAVWPGPRAGHLSFSVGGELFLLGGYSGDGGYDFLNDFYVSQLSDSQLIWKKIELEEGKHVLPLTARGSGAAAIYKGGVYTYGGYDGLNKIPSRILHLFNPKTRIWSEVPSWLEFPDDPASILSMAKGSSGEKPTPRYGHSSVFNPSNGQLTIFGGSGSTYLNDILQFELDDE